MKIQITAAEDALKCIPPFLFQEEEQEYLIAMTLNASNIVKAVHFLSVGGLDQTVIDVRCIARNAILDNATSVIIAHNHPSGNAKPSFSDTKQTEAVRDGLKTLNISLLDHIIVANGDNATRKDIRNKL